MAFIVHMLVSFMPPLPADPAQQSKACTNEQKLISNQQILDQLSAAWLFCFAADPSSRYSIVPSTGAALLLVSHVDRSNFGLTLDFGHLLLAGENPAQSVALVGQAGKLYGLQLNDAHVKLGAEDGLSFASVNVVAAMEMIRWLQMLRFDGHIYFDTFPQVEDPVQEARQNIDRFKTLWGRVISLAGLGMNNFAESEASDGLGTLQGLFKV